MSKSVLIFESIYIINALEIFLKVQRILQDLLKEAGITEPDKDQKEKLFWINRVGEVRSIQIRVKTPLKTKE